MFGPQPARYTIDTTKTTQFSDAWVILALILFVAGLVARSGYLTGAGAMLLVVAGAGRLWNWLALRGVRYTRAFSETRAFPGETVTLTLALHNAKPLPVAWLVVRDRFPPALEFDGRVLTANAATGIADFATFWMPGARQTIRRRLAVHCTQRGIYRFGPAIIESGDGFGFFEARRAEAGEDRLIVYPRLYTLDELRIPARHPFGPQRATLPLHEDPLRPAGAREYQVGDSLRRIHWAATARTGELFSRVYEASEERQVAIALNVATMPRHWQGVHTELHERAVSVAASLAALALEQRIPTGVIANGTMPNSDQPLRLLPGRSPRQLLHILEMLAAVTPFASATIEDLVSREAPRLPWGVALVVVSAIAHEELLVTLEDVAAAGRRVVLVPLGPERLRLLHNVEIWPMAHLASV